MWQCSAIIFLLNLSFASAAVMDRLLSRDDSAFCSPCKFEISKNSDGMIYLRRQKSKSGTYVSQMDIYPYGQGKVSDLKKTTIWLKDTEIDEQDLQLFTVDLNQDRFNDIAMQVSQGSNARKYFRYWLYDKQTRQYKNLTSNKGLVFPQLESIDKDHFYSLELDRGIEYKKQFKLTGNRLVTVSTATTDHSFQTKKNNKK